MAAASSSRRCSPRASSLSEARCDSSGSSTSPSSPRVQVTSVTCAPSATYLAIVAPVPMHSSSGWACTRSRRRSIRKGSRCLRSDDDHVQRTSRHFPRQEAATRALPPRAPPRLHARPRRPSGRVHPQCRRSRPRRAPLGRRGGRHGALVERLVVDARELRPRGRRPAGRREGPARADARDDCRHHRLLRRRRRHAGRVQPRRRAVHRRPAEQGAVARASCRTRARSSTRGSPRTGGRSPSSAVGRCASWRRRRRPRPRALAQPDDETQSWGLADFVAAEELDRSGGCGGWPAARPSSPSTSTSRRSPSAGSPIRRNPDREPHPPSLPGGRHRQPRRAPLPDLARRRAGRDPVGPRRVPVPRHRRIPTTTAGRRERPQPRPAAPADPRRLPRAAQRAVVRERVTAPVGHDPARRAQPTRPTARCSRSSRTPRTTASSSSPTASRSPRPTSTSPDSWTRPPTASSSPRSPALGPARLPRSRRRRVRRSPRASGSTPPRRVGRHGRRVHAIPTAPGMPYAARLAEATGASPRSPSTRSSTRVVTFARVTDRELACAILWPTGHVPGSATAAGRDGARTAARTMPASSTPPGLRRRPVAGGPGLRRRRRRRCRNPGTRPRLEFEVAPTSPPACSPTRSPRCRRSAELYPDLDLDRVGITGWSFGGYLAALAVLDRPDVFHAAVAGAPVTDWALYDTAYTERYLGLPAEHPEAYHADLAAAACGPARAPAADHPRARRRQRAGGAHPAAVQRAARRGTPALRAAAQRA